MKTPQLTNEGGGGGCVSDQRCDLVSLDVDRVQQLAASGGQCLVVRLQVDVLSAGGQQAGY